MRLVLMIGCGALVGAAVACGTFPETRMEPSADYAMGRSTVSGSPAYTAGDSYVTTTARDGSTAALGCDGRLYAETAHADQTC